MMTGPELYEVIEPFSAARGTRRDNPVLGRLGICGLLAAAVISAGVVSTREAAGVVPPAATTDEAGRASPADILDEAGLGRLRLGMTTTEYRQLGPDAGSGRSSYLVAVDYAHSCAQYEAVLPLSGDVAWVWLRDNVVVAVGVETGPDPSPGTPRMPGTTVLGARLGGAMAAVAQLPQRWSWDSSGPVRLARRATDTGEVTLADIDGDGSLDYARTATAAADACRVDRRRSPELQTVEPGAATIDRESLSGVSLGLDAVRVTAVSGWFELGSPMRPCRRFGAGHGAAAQALDGRVVAVSADHLAEGPAVGDTLESALATLGVTAAPGDVTPGREVVHHLFVLPGGRLIALDAAVPYQLQDELDRSYPVGEPTVRSITIGRPCAP